MEGKINVLIADDKAAIVKRYQAILQRVKGITVSTAGSGYEAVFQAANHRPDIVLMDIEMETKTAGLEAARQILKQLPGTKIIILTVYEDKELICEAFQLGVIDYLLKTATDEEVVQAVRDAHADNSPIRPYTAATLRTEFMRVKAMNDSLIYFLDKALLLSPSEISILLLLSRGLTRREIGEARKVELTTIKNQIHSILKKMNCANTEELLRHLDTLNVRELFMSLGAERE